MAAFLRDYVNNQTWIMLKNYLKLAWRNLWRYRTYSLINICGLSIGLACCLLIILYLKDEWSFDRFHKQADNLYQINYTWGDKENPTTLGRSPRYLGPVLAGQLPGIKGCVRFAERSAVAVRGEEVFLEEVTFADRDFFSMFSFPLLQGNPETALDGLLDIVLTREMAVKYFGQTDVTGRELEVRIENEPYRFIVSAVAAGAPDNSSIQFDIVVNTAIYDKIRPPEDDYYRWTNPAYTTFLLLAPHTDPGKTADNINRITKDYPAKATEEFVREKVSGSVFYYDLAPLKDVHLRRKTIDFDMEHFSRPKYGYILFLLAAGILLIACLNYINLSLSQSLKRSGEIGIRKAMGGGRGQLIRQFSLENLLIIFLSMLLAFGMVSVSLPWFSQLSNKSLRLAYFADWKILLSVFFLLLITVIFTSLKPALYALKLKTVSALRNRQVAPGSRLFASSLVVIQFVLATLLIVSTLVINLQSRYLREKDLGYNDESLLKINLPSDHLSGSKSHALKNELQQYIRFQSAALGDLRTYAGMDIEANKVKSNSFYLSLDENFLETARITLKSGRAFTQKDHLSDVLVNEAFVEKFGIKYPIGGKITLGGDSEYTIIGVVKDFHSGSLDRISPLFIKKIHSHDGGYNLYIRLPAGNISEDLAAIAAVFRKHFPYFPFNPQFQEDINERQYRAELRWQKIVNYACGMAIFVACCGLLGLSLLSAHSRTKEVGIRKVLGASVRGVVVLLSKDFIKPVLLAILLASPLAWYIMTKWLENFFYRIELQWWVFALAGLLAVTVALFTVSFQSIKAALANPADSLRNE